VEVGAAPFELGAARIEVLGPPADRALLESENDRSVVLAVRHGAVSFLLTGDLEEAGEEALRLSGPVTVMKAPHHGSRTSSSPELLARTLPRHVVFCVGRGNRFGFPHPEVVERYEQIGARCYRTDLDGAITFKSDGRDVTVETFRDEGRVWRAARPF
jgi:competence protein ComEC